jgi:hypothetical protein
LGWDWPWAWDRYYGPWFDAPEGAVSATVGAPSENLTPVALDVSPDDALLYLNGVLIGVARDFNGQPDVLFLRAGHYAVALRLPGYRGRAFELDASGAAATIPIALELVPDHSGGARAPYRPPEGLPYGRVFGPDFGRAPGRLGIGPQPGLRPEPFPVAGAVMAPPPGAPATGLAALRIQVSPPTAAIYLDGEFLGSAAELGHLQRGIAVPSGPHRIEALAPGCAGKSVTIETEPGKELRVTLELMPAR